MNLGKHEKIATASETAAWWVREEAKGLTPRTQAERDAWLAQDETHREAWQAAHQALDMVERFAAEPEMMALRRAALEDRPRRGYNRLVAAGLVGVMIVATGGLVFSPDRAPHTAARPAAASLQSVAHATAVGERSTITLPDGSVMTLNTDSRAEVVYSQGERGIRLLGGQALFAVAHGHDAPFRVYAGDRVVVATGTQFDVWLEPGSVQVALIEGGVDVERRRQGVAALMPWVKRERLVPGQVLRARGETAYIRHEDVSRLTSWRNGVAVFSETPLSEAVAEINRYSRNPIVLDARAGHYRVSGTFRTGNAGRFARTMAELFSLEAKTSEDGQIILSFSDL